ncbi:MAG TPA: isoprenylcysteine carboxylmethyltransferase family protein [Terriglobales bacterium]|jgi:protein-S-isoprenylcysteine O-methyltransferase Ste14|nr:isoprenylcysteine carboxylmethyltransferase family protein [Terriglobales bacterium]
MTNLLEKLIRFVAVFVLAFEMPVPVYWLVLHGPVSFWRKHRRSAFPVAVLAAWGIGDAVLFLFHRELFLPDSMSWVAAAALVLIGFDVFTFSTCEAALGSRRIVGHSELAGSRELIARGLYARVRHPRYLGMMAGVFGACLVIAALPLWTVSVAWLLLALISIRAEEHELRDRLGATYAAYSEQVPALLPFRLISRQSHIASRRNRT